MARRAARRGRRGGAPTRAVAERRAAQEPRLSSPPLSSPGTSLVMRKCACGSGGAAGVDDKCDKCRSRGVQRKPVEHAGSAAFDVSRVAIAPPEARAERDADRMAEHATSVLAGTDAGPAPVLSAVDGVHRARSETASGLIVEDDAELLTTGQMRKLEFLADLERDACAAADRVLIEVGRSTDGCPYVAKWIGYYRNRDASLVERAIQKYAPETRFASTARGYIPLVSARIARGVHTWAVTGRMPDLPPELMGAMHGG